MDYCVATDVTKRFKTRQVMVGNVGVGASNPIRIQSMTTSPTHDVAATVEQIKRLADCGCEIVRVTVQGIKEADACEGIKNSLIQQGYNIPLAADIHFFPSAALHVVNFVDKVRINPGNFADKRAQFKILEYDDESYAQELLRIEEKFCPLIEKCKQLKRSLRIGTNHGSLSDRIMNRYGDTPQGMVESAFEYARICRRMDFHDIIFSMKSSNPKVMILAYRLLVAEMRKVGWDYPLHLGVTEAGDGEDGRVKSAMGIGTLLLDGLGDTLRVSLTEDPWYEIEPCKQLIQFAGDYAEYEGEAFTEKHRKFDAIGVRRVIRPNNVSLHRDGSVLLKISAQDIHAETFAADIGVEKKDAEVKLKGDSADVLVLNEDRVGDLKKLANQLNPFLDAGVSIAAAAAVEGTIPLHPVNGAAISRQFNASHLQLFGKNNPKAVFIEINAAQPQNWQCLLPMQDCIVLLQAHKDRVHSCRHFFEWLQSNQLQFPVILNFRYNCAVEDLVIHAAAECGALLTDGLGEGVLLEGPYDKELLRRLSFTILQASRMRTIRTDFISCPSCGRTLFNLQDVTARIRHRTSHLPGVKIAIMGCIVNGPGEMADADFGYVGSKPGKIDLYVGKERVEKDIDFADADDRLVALIKAYGRWLEPAAG